MTYASVEQATAYHSARLSGEAWSALPEGRRTAALQSASDLMDQYALARGGFSESWEAGAVPEPLQRACALLALELTDSARMARLTAQQQGVTATNMGSASESYSGQGAASWALISPAVEALLRPWLKRSGGMVPIR